MLIKQEYVLIKSYFCKRQFVKQELYGYSDKKIDCVRLLEEYGHTMSKNNEPFVSDEERVVKIRHFRGLDVRAGDKLITFRIHRITLVLHTL